MRNILIYCSHPAQFLFFKNAIVTIKKLNIDVCLVIKDKDVLESLVIASGLAHIKIEDGRNVRKISIITSFFSRIYNLAKLVKETRAELLIGTDSALSIVGRITRTRNILTLEDDFKVIWPLALLGYPLTDAIFAPNVCNVGLWNSKHIGYNGYMKLAYLAPKYLTLEQRSRPGFLDVNKRYALIRLSALNAFHDIGVGGVNTDVLRSIVELLEQKGIIPIISSEQVLKGELSRYSVNFKPSQIHAILKYSEILISDSQSMTVEAAIIGTPSVRISSLKGKISVLEEIESHYNLSWSHLPSEVDNILNTVNNLLSNKIILQEYLVGHKKLLEEKCDVTEALVHICCNSQKIIAKKYYIE
jgi:predicted glycosyltransferase